MTTDLQYPIGRFNYDQPYTESEREKLIRQLAATPAELREAYIELPRGGVDTPYRPGGWTARQVIHHVPESHMNSYLRFKFAMTENEPTIKPYDEAVWAMQPDVATTPLEVSLMLLDALHARWVAFLETLKPEDWDRSFRHPEIGRVTLDRALGLYAWHGRHHTAHLRLIRDAAAAR
ncbi:MAG TPA: putative metal-dependent hydrolase [Bryobacteraceae bacterium]|jgi:hypothetical protein